MSAASATSGLRLRRDLICQKLEMASQAVWVLKAPLSKELHYLSEDEYAILQLLDGHRTVRELFFECSRRFKSRFIAPDAFIHFLAEAKRKQLLVVSSGRLIAEASVARTSLPSADVRFWSSFLAYRFPGIRPGRFLGLLSSGTEVLIKPSVIAIYITLVLTAAIIAFLNLSAIVEGASEAFLQRGAETWLALVVVIAAVKVIHEFAHAAACRLFGRDCREVGVMLLMGIPCLYCDVSDAWLMPERYKRILVSAAGMIAELALASAAVFVWLVSTNPVLSQWCLIVMTVCSISTLLVNGNPLMRYDGYFILCDLVAIPNLGSKATTALQHVVQKYLWRESSTNRSLNESSLNVGLPLYAIASLLYRMFVFVSMGWFLFRFTVGQNLAAPGILLAVALVAVALTPELRMIFSPPQRAFFARQESRVINPLRFAVLLLAMLVLVVPVPRTIVVPMHVWPANAQTIYAGSNGLLKTIVQEGALVKKGDMIAVIKSHEKETSLIESETELALLTVARQNIEAVRQSRPEMGASLLAASSAESAAIERVSLIRDERERLALKAPIDGMVFIESRLPPTYEDGSSTQSCGSYFDSCNEGIAVQSGVPICMVGSEKGREAILYVDQKQASLVHRDQLVNLLVPGDNAQQTRIGTVIEISSTPSFTKPTARAVTEDPSKPVVDEGHYQIRVALEESAMPLPVHMTGYARIHIEPISLTARLVRLIFQSVRF